MPNEKLSIEFLTKMHSEILGRIRSKVGEPVIPNKKEALEFLEEQTKVKFPRSFMYIYDMVQDRPTWYKGHDIMGIISDKGVSPHDIIDRYHENHRLIIVYQTLKLQELFLELKDKLSTEIYYSTRRALRDASGKCWNVHYTAQPFQFDKNGYWVSYFSRWILLSEYQGEGITAEFFYEGNEPEKYKDVIRELNNKLESFKAETFSLLGFTRIQRQVLKYWGIDGTTTKSIAETLELSSKGIEYHSSNIIRIAKEIFPINNFKEAKDVANYLKLQGII